MSIAGSARFNHNLGNMGPAGGITSYNASIYTDNNIPPYNDPSQSSQLGFAIEQVNTPSGIHTDRSMIFERQDQSMMTPTGVSDRGGLAGPHHTHLAGSLTSRPHLNAQGSSKNHMKSTLEEILDRQLRDMQRLK